MDFMFRLELCQSHVISKFSSFQTSTYNKSQSCSQEVSRFYLADISKVFILPCSTTILCIERRKHSLGGSVVHSSTAKQDDVRREDASTIHLIPKL